MTYPRIENRLAIIQPYAKNKSVLDIGCVDARPGDVRKYESTGLHKFLMTLTDDIQGVDIDAEGAKEMQASGYNVVAADAEDMDLNQQFDCIVAGEIIEHLNNAGKFLETMNKHLKDHGVLIITTPNACGILNTLRIIKGNNIKVHPGHTCWYDPITLTQLVNRYQLCVKNIYFTNKKKWYQKKYFYKIFSYQLPKFITWLRPFFSGTIIAVIVKDK